MSERYIAGIDFGSDSVRWLAVNAETGEEVAEAVAHYERWQTGEFCDSSISQYRQHPADLLNAMVRAAESLRADMGAQAFARIQSIGVDTTGSTPIAIDQFGSALALRSEFYHDPDAMFVLWKDHTAIEEAERITRAAKAWPTDFTRYVGGQYSSEWFWAKLLRIVERNPEVAANLHSFVELCDWIPAVLTCTTAPQYLKRSRCASGHKTLWNASWGGLPENQFFHSIHPQLSKVKDNIGDATYTSDQAVGRLCQDWADRLGLTTEVTVAVGAFDCHMGAIGASAEDHQLVKVVGTSTCDILTVDPVTLGDRCIEGICGQVDGSVIPGKIGLEAGQSAFGDYYAWFEKLFTWVEALTPGSTPPSPGRLLARFNERLVDYLPTLDAPIALDWINGRRTPNANQRLKANFYGLNLGSDPLDLYHAVVESTAFGARAINECFETQDVAIHQVLAIGGIPKKAGVVMQICADVFNKPLEVKASDQCCALGAAICGAVAHGVYPDIATAQQVLASPTERRYEPRPEVAAVYEQRYRQYQTLARQTETTLQQEA